MREPEELIEEHKVEPLGEPPQDVPDEQERIFESPDFVRVTGA